MSEQGLDGPQFLVRWDAQLVRRTSMHCGGTLAVQSQWIVTWVIVCIVVRVVSRMVCARVNTTVHSNVCTLHCLLLMDVRGCTLPPTEYTPYVGVCRYFALHGPHLH